MVVSPVQGLSLIFTKKAHKTACGKDPLLHRKLVTAGYLLSPKQSKLTQYLLLISAHTQTATSNLSQIKTKSPKKTVLL